VNLTQDQVRLALYAVRDLVTRRTLGGQPIPHGFHALLNQLVTSDSGSESPTAEPPLGDGELIGATRAAEILNCSARWVRAIRNDLDGQYVDGRWLFQRHTVVAYAEERHTA
jgi:hypothetical protein